MNLEDIKTSAFGLRLQDLTPDDRAILEDMLEYLVRKGKEVKHETDAI